MKHFLNYLLTFLLCFSSVACSQQRLSKGLVAYYPFNGNANDESGNGNHGKRVGVKLTKDRFGTENKAYAFNGVNANIIVPSSVSLNFSQSFTISCWSNKNGNDPSHGSLVATGGSSCTKGFLLQHRDGGVRVEYSDGVGGWDCKVMYKQSLGCEDGQWHHFVYVVDKPNELANVFVDGIRVITDFSLSGEGNIQRNDVSLRIGALNSNPSDPQYFNGAIDDIRIYNRALTDTEIKQLYNEQGWSGGFSVEKGEYLETYTFYNLDTDNYLNLTLSGLNRTSDGRLNATQVGSLSFYLPTDNMCRQYTTSTRCDLNALPIASIPQGARESEFVYILRTDHTQPQLTLNVYDSRQPQNLNTLQYSAPSASELGKVCRLIMPPNLPSNFKGFFGEGNEIHNDVRVINCILWDLAGTVLELQATQSDQGTLPSDLANTYSTIRPYQKYYYTRER